ncbi:response regulator transcription factor [Paenibacillus elgii]|uniref:response regulator transcription factor n=1 Tax=Paenibacillus elgii TaxID=189691 RepID=UPI001F4869FF|nr:response regulator transcription factor [Paenibacillus elgii]
MKDKTNILLVEDDPEIARVIRDYLTTEGYRITWSSTGGEGWEDFNQDKYDLVLVDLMLPEMDGLSLCRNIRLNSDVPMIIVSAHHEDHHKVSGLTLGADDYLTKPFSLAELSARILSHLRRYRRYQGEREETGQRVDYRHGLSICFTKQRVFLSGEEILLTAKELALILLLAKHPYRTFSKKELYEQIWHQAEVDGNNTVTVHIKCLRTKLKDVSREALFIQTVWGSGYRFIGEPCDET